VKVSRKAATKAGVTSGNVILTNILIVEAPSIIADSSIPNGKDLNASRVIITTYGRNKVEYASISASGVSYNLTRDIKIKKGIESTTGGISLKRINPITIVVLSILLNSYLAKE
jgi:hypothetical protein